MKAILDLFDLTKVFRLGLVAVGAIAAWGTWLWQHDSKVEKRVTQEIVQRSETQGAQNAAQSEKAHTAAAKPGAFERLRKDPRTCPDCR